MTVVFIRGLEGGGVSGGGGEGGGSVPLAQEQARPTNRGQNLFIDRDFNCNQQVNSASVKEEIRKFVGA